MTNTITLQQYASEFYGEQVHLGWNKHAGRFYVQFEDGTKQVIPYTPSTPAAPLFASLPARV